ncbi:acid-binding, heart-like isoform X2 [Octopus vulgaris]|uniref:Acid-binding, heart-like isoform X2 n=1 Tax=Octopus vulgaris TaxID=6645 RepID=A0AA36C1J2_OCTVU|nr:acid-binding, heart-like isoform X2 [Octopus vulgaris]
MASKLCGKWQIISSDNFDEYMKAVGVTAENRALANDKFSGSSKLCQLITNDGDSWTIKTITSVGEREVAFKIGEDFDSQTIDGRAVKVSMKMDGDTLVETQVGNGVESINNRSVEGANMIMTMSACGVTCTRKYEKV